MPSCITHQLIAEEVCSSLPVPAAEAVRFAPDYYYLGAQGPDLFFFYRIFSGKEKNLGRLLHRKHAYEVFLTFYELLRGEFFKNDSKQKSFAYLCGYLSHYSADVAFHPFVYAYLEKYGDEGFLHQKIENDWDVYFLQTKQHREAEDYEFPFSASKIAEENVLFVLYSLLFARINETALSESSFTAMLKLFEKYLNFFHGECYSSQRGWKKAESFFGAKPRLSRLFPSQNPEKRFITGEHFFELTGGKAQNADELFSIAVDETVKLTSVFCECLQSGKPLPKTPFNLNFHDGTEEI